MYWLIYSNCMKNSRKPMEKKKKEDIHSKEMEQPYFMITDRKTEHHQFMSVPPNFNSGFSAVFNKYKLRELLGSASTWL